MIEHNEVNTESQPARDSGQHRDSDQSNNVHSGNRIDAESGSDSLTRPDTGFNKETLLERFSDFLQSLERKPPLQAGTAGETTDLYSLFVALSALKNEVKIESRWVKNAFDEFKNLFAHLQTVHEQLARELDNRKDELSRQRQQLLKPVFSDWIDQRDRMEELLNSIDQVRPRGWRKWFAGRQDQVLSALAEGQQMSLRRLDDCLMNFDIRPIPVLGLPLNPGLMRATDIGRDPHQAEGVVIEELRRGYLWEESVLRVAEVRVNKQTSE